MAKRAGRGSWARWALRAKPGWRGLPALVLVAAVVVVLLTPGSKVMAVQPGPAEGGTAPATDYQVTLWVGSGAQYNIVPGGRVDLPITLSVTGGVKLATATVQVKYDPTELRPVACVRSPAGPGGYCNSGWDTATGLVRFNILEPGGVALGTVVEVFTLSFEPASTATLPRTNTVTPLLESIADEYGNYMSSWLQGSTIRVTSAAPTGTTVYVGGQDGPNPITIPRGGTVTVRVEVVRLPAEPRLGLGSATFTLSFSPSILRALECRPIQSSVTDDRSGSCALHADRVSANVTSPSGLTGTVTAFEVIFTTGPTAVRRDRSPLTLTAPAFATPGGAPIPVALVNNVVEVASGSAVVPVLAMSPTTQSLYDDGRVTVDVTLTNAAELASGTWGIHYRPTTVQAEGCEFFANGFCNATGEANLVQMTMMVPPGGPPLSSPFKVATITFRRHPSANASEVSPLSFAVTSFANSAGEQLEYQTVNASIRIEDPLGSGPAVAISFTNSQPSPHPLAQGAFIDFPIRFDIDPARPLVNLSGSISYNPLVLRPTRCMRADDAAPGYRPAGFCNSETEQLKGIIRFNLLADSDAGFSGSFTPFVFRMEAASTSQAGDRSALDFTVEAISGPGGAPRTWSVVNQTVSVKAPVAAWQVIAGPPAVPPAVETMSIYTVTLGSPPNVPPENPTVPIWLKVPDPALVPIRSLGAATVEVRYHSYIGRATSCTLRQDLSPQLDGGYCTLLPGVVRAAFVSSGGITANTHVLDIVFEQAPNATAGQSTPLSVVIDNFVDTSEVPIPTSPWGSRLDISCYSKPVTDLRIERSGSDLRLTWSHVGSTAVSYQVWRSETNAYFAFGDTYSSMPAIVPPPATGTSVSYLDLGTYNPGTGTGISTWADNLNHYYMVRSMCAATQGAPRSNRVGKFTRLVAYGMNMVSLPLISLPELPYSYRIQDVVGAQLSGASSELYADRLWYWDTTRQDYTYAWLIAGVGPAYDGKWWEGKTWQESRMLLPANTGFWIQSRHDYLQHLKVLGNVAEPNTQGLQIVQDMQLIGSAYPDPVVLSLDEATFREDGAQGASSELRADRIWYWNESLQDYEYAWLIAGVGPAYDGRWWNGRTWSESRMTLRPGVGYWYQRRAATDFIWSNPGPQLP